MMVGAVILRLLLVGQGATETAPSVAPKSVEPTVSSPALSIPDETIIYTYNPFGKRDPFRSFLDEKGLLNTESGDPLLNFELSKFILTAIVWGIPNPMAVVVDGDSRGHIITRGTRMGKNRGQVTRILKDRLIVAEEYRDPLGKLMVSEFVMKLNMKEDPR